MGNKKLIKEDLARFNQIMGYNPSKGLIKEEGEQLSMDFPTELTSEEQEVSNALDAMVSFIERNTKAGYDQDGNLVKGKGQKLFYLHNLEGRNSIKNEVERIKAQLKGDIKRQKGWSRYDSRKSGVQKIMPFNTGEVNNLEDFLNLLDFIINSLDILGIDSHDIEHMRSMLSFRVKSDREESERRAEIGLADFEECPSCDEYAYEPGYGCENCGHINDEDY